MIASTHPRFVCPEAGCGAALTAYYTFKAGHPVDEERGYLYERFGGNVSFGARWDVDCSSGHRLGTLTSEDLGFDDDEGGDVEPQQVETWLLGRLSKPQEPETITVHVAGGCVVAATDSRGNALQISVQETGPSPWVNCDACGMLYPADNVNDFGAQGWLCYKCEPAIDRTCDECGEHIEPDETLWIELGLETPKCDHHAAMASE